MGVCVFHENSMLQSGPNHKDFLIYTRRVYLSTKENVQIYIFNFPIVVYYTNAGLTFIKGIRLQHSAAGRSLVPANDLQTTSKQSSLFNEM